VDELIVRTTLHRVLPGWLVGAAAVLAAAPFSTRGADNLSATEKADPAAIKVLLLAPVDAMDGAATLRRQTMRICQQRAFLSRHFTVLSEALAARAAKAPPALKIESIGDRTAEVLDELARRTGSDWVVSVGVRDVKVDDLDPPDVSTWFLHCSLSLQVRNARRHEWLANRDYTGRIFTAGPPPELLLDVVEVGTNEALASVLWPYPVVVPVSRDGRIVDYLKGASQPVLARPGRIFSGWNANEGSGESP
jgi:hypothetical protein